MPIAPIKIKGKETMMDIGHIGIFVVPKENLPIGGTPFAFDMSGGEKVGGFEDSI